MGNERTRHGTWNSQKSFPQNKISFGGIPNSSRLMPSLTTLAHSCSAVVLPIWTMSSPKEIQKQSHSCSCQGWKATNHTETLLNLAKHWNSPEPSGTFRQLPPERTPAHAGTLRNFPEPSGTFRNLPPEATPAHTGTLPNLPPEPTPAHTKTLRNLPEPSGTFRKLPPEPTPAHTGTLRNLPEPASGTYYTSTHRKPTPAHTGTLRNLPELSGTFRNLPPEPAPQTRTGAHRSLSGLKTPLAYAVGEKNEMKSLCCFFHLVGGL